ncbi:MAG: glycosyltransferase [Synechococcaceae bacterium WB7_1B_046]|nr:glycosyltransferase [Synechococcaceae bacterium WB7_1B_046]
MTKAPLKMVHLSSAHPDRDVRIFLKECCSLAQRFPNAEVHLVLAGVEARKEANVWIHSVPARSGNRLHRMWTTVNEVYAKALELQGDIYHLHDPELLRIALKLKRKGKTVLYDAHEDLPRQLLGKNYLPLKKWVSKAFERYENYIVKRLDAIVTATPFIRERFEKIHPRVVDINNYPLRSEIAFDEEGDKERIHVAYIGGISRIRGISQLVQAMSLTETTLHLAGEIPADYLEELKAIPGWTQVVAHGHVSRKAAQEIKQGAFAGIVPFLPFPNHIHAQPNKIFEYMASGIPVIGSHFPLWKNLIQDHELGICIDPENPKALAEAIETLRKDPQRARAMGARGKHLVNTKFNWSAEEEKLVNLYQSLVNR